MRFFVGGRARAARRLPLAVLAVAVTAASAGCVPGVPGHRPPLPEGWRGYQSATYRDDARWLCRGGRPGDLCAEADLDTTVVQPDGSASVEHHEPARHPAVDCFYVYPTASADPVPNSDLVPGPEEIGTVLGQAAPLTSSCRVFAPVYRQVPFTAATTPGFTQEQGRAALEVAYRDVLDAFKHYIANDSRGRPFVLYGHSQGGMHLARLIAEEVEHEPALRRRLVSALLIGTTTLTVPEGRTVGGTFDRVPLCRRRTQLGCLVAYSSYDAADPPGPTATFGRATEPGMQVPCVNPAAPRGGTAVLRSSWPTGGFATQGPYADPARNAEVTTPRFATPGLASAGCAVRDGASYLEVTVHADPADPRMDSVGGQFALIPGFGLHLIDIDLAIGDLADLVATQGRAFRR